MIMTCSTLGKKIEESFEKLFCSYTILLLSRNKRNTIALILSLKDSIFETFSRFYDFAHGYSGKCLTFNQILITMDFQKSSKHQGKLNFSQLYTLFHLFSVFTSQNCICCKSQNEITNNLPNLEEQNEIKLG